MTILDVKYTGHKSIMLFHLFCSYRLDPEAHEGDSPRAVEIAAFEGRVETFTLLTKSLEADSNSVWLSLAQV